ncbi:MAG: FAD-dependent oxidoreductase [Acidobacteriota bacterium]
MAASSAPAPPFVADRRDLLARPVRDGARLQCDVLVVGLGFGAALCDRLSADGWSVVGIDRAHGRGSTFTNQNWKHSGALYLDVDIARRLAAANRERSLPERQSLLSTGSRFLCGDAELLERHLAVCRAAGVDSRRLGHDASPGGVPLRAGTEHGFVSSDSVIDYGRVVRCHLDHARARGARILLPATLEAIERTDDAVTGSVIRHGGELHRVACRTMVLACGAWTGEVAARAGLDLQLRNWVSPILVVRRRLVSEITVFIDEPHLTLVPVGETTLVSNSSRQPAVGPDDRRPPSTASIRHVLDELRRDFPILRTVDPDEVSMRRCIKSALVLPSESLEGPLQEDGLQKDGLQEDGLQKDGLQKDSGLAPCVLGEETLGVEGLLATVPGKASLLWQGAGELARRVAQLLAR